MRAALFCILSLWASEAQGGAQDSEAIPKWKGKALFPSPELLAEENDMEESSPERRMGEIKCLNATYHEMPDGMVMLNSEMSPNPCPVTVCLNSTHHKMPDGMVMLNSDMTPDPCADCTEYPCDKMGKPKGGGGHPHGGSGAHDKPAPGGSGAHEKPTTKKPDTGGSGSHDNHDHDDHAGSGAMESPKTTTEAATAPGADADVAAAWKVSPFLFLLSAYFGNF